MASSTTGTQEYLNTYTTYSGADIVASFAGVEIGALSGITFSVTREKAPIYTMGSPNPRSFSRGKRGIAGSLIFTVFDRPALYDMLAGHNNGEDMKYWTRTHNILGGQNTINTHRGIAQVGNDTQSVVSSVPYYADQIPPFDITITFANEYGQAAARSIYGVELLNEGSGASMDDIVLEETMTYVARELGPMYSIGVGGAEISDLTASAVSENLSTNIIRP